ncbi:MAG: SirB1 family protein [Gemmataceae bacterium]
MEVDATLECLARNPATECDLAELALHLARDEFPDLDVAIYLAAIEDYADRLRPKLRGSLTKKVATLSKLLFVEEKYRGNRERYYDPDNSYLNRVIDRRLGLPITLSLLTAAVGTRAGLTVEGVGLPGHFIARAADGADVLLFDPYHGGAPLKIADCEQLVEDATGKPFEASAEALEPTPPGYAIRRMLTNLKGTYLRQNDFVRTARVTRRILQLEPTSAIERRDLGICLARTGRPGEAIDLLESYLNSSPSLNDAESIRKLLRHAKAEVARWN